jgi:hypothetical protein
MDKFLHELFTSWGYLSLCVTFMSICQIPFFVSIGTFMTSVFFWLGTKCLYSNCLIEISHQKRRRKKGANIAHDLANDNDSDVLNRARKTELLLPFIGPFALHKEGKPHGLTNQMGPFVRTAANRNPEIPCGQISGICQDIYRFPNFGS